MSEAVKNKALDYYPKLWSKERLAALVEAGKLTTDEYQEITGEAYEVSEEVT